MAYADSDGVRIHYELEGAGPPLVLQHGLSGSMKNWYFNGYVDGLKGDYRLILVDARGHGSSDKPYDAEAYDQRHMARDIVAVLDNAGFGKANYWGYSMGGSIGFALAEVAPERIESFVIGGMHPYPMNRDGLDQMIASLKNGMDAWFQRAQGRNPNISPERKAQMLSNDPEAIIGATLGLRDRTDMSHVLPTMTAPTMVYAGDVDELHAGAERCVKVIPNVNWVSLPGLDHIQASDRSDVVLPHVTKFLATLTQAPA